MSVRVSERRSFEEIRLDATPDTSAVLGKQRMSSWGCRECGVPLGSPRALSAHLRFAHPQTVPTPPQRAPEPPAGKKEAKVPPTLEELTCTKCGRADFVALKGRVSHERFCKGNGGGASRG